MAPPSLLHSTTELAWRLWQASTRSAHDDDDDLQQLGEQLACAHNILAGIQEDTASWNAKTPSRLELQDLRGPLKAAVQALYAPLREAEAMLLQGTPGQRSKRAVSSTSCSMLSALLLKLPTKRAQPQSFEDLSASLAKALLTCSAILPEGTTAHMQASMQAGMQAHVQVHVHASCGRGSSTRSSFVPLPASARTGQSCPQLHVYGHGCKC